MDPAFVNQRDGSRVIESRLIHGFRKGAGEERVKCGRNIRIGEGLKVYNFRPAASKY